MAKWIIKEVNNFFIDLIKMLIWFFVIFTSACIFAHIMSSLFPEHSSTPSKYSRKYISSSKPSPENKEPDFREVRLPHDFSIIVPRGWVVSPKVENNEQDNLFGTIFYARYFTVSPKHTTASIDIRYNSKSLGITQNDLKYVKSRVKKL